MKMIKAHFFGVKNNKKNDKKIHVNLKYRSLLWTRPSNPLAPHRSKLWRYGNNICDKILSLKHIRITKYVHVLINLKSYLPYCPNHFYISQKCHIQMLPRILLVCGCIFRKQVALTKVCIPSFLVHSAMVRIWHCTKSYPLRISLINVTKPAVSWVFGHIYWRYP